MDFYDIITIWIFLEKVKQYIKHIVILLLEFPSNASDIHSFRYMYLKTRYRFHTIETVYDHIYINVHIFFNQRFYRQNTHTL